MYQYIILFVSIYDTLFCPIIHSRIKEYKNLFGTLVSRFNGLYVNYILWYCAYIPSVWVIPSMWSVVLNHFLWLMQVVQLFSCLDKISYIEWALDSEYILCGLYKKPMIQAWSLSQPEWTCKIDEGLAGIAYARWSPDSRHILTTSDFQLRLTVWSLVNTACVHVQLPKHASKGVSFTKDGKFAAICTRRDCKDYVNLLSCHSWEIMGMFAVDTLDLADVEWSPDDSSIVIWDSPLDYKVINLSTFSFLACEI